MATTDDYGNNMMMEEEVNDIVPINQAAEVTSIRTTEDILAYLQKKNPDIIPFDYQGRMYIKFDDFYLAICNVSAPSSARNARKRLFSGYPELATRLIISKPSSKLRELARALFCVLMHLREFIRSSQYDLK